MKQVEYEYYLSEEDRLRVEFSTERGKVTQFMIQYEANLGGKWQPLIRYDTAHGEVHRHIFVIGKEAVRQVLKGRTPEDALIQARLDLRRRWQRVREEYERGLEKCGKKRW